MAGRIEVVVFDCDSTLSRLEGIDELARRAGAGDLVAALTADAMDGRIAMEDVYGRRLQLVRPGAADLEWLGERYVATLVAGADRVVRALAAEGREVHVVSGGVRQPVVRLAAALGIDASRVHAVDVRLDAHGRYAGWDQDAPTARGGGKAAVVGAIAAGRPAVMVGDGVTDLEARASGARVIGFGGVAVRRRVRDEADAWVAGPSLDGVLDVIRNWDGA
ncbi:MAG TPA: HAD-IB family phosphatase [Candidatus Krumholzibacteria bacterium]|nr:HAD-IB family phosphatase [Candidatus Krumholzibacteria bacterium]